MSTAAKVPLFITRYSLSSRTAIGIQTRRLIDANADWLHFHWWTSEYGRQDPRSILLENWFVSRYSVFKRSRIAKSALQFGGFSRWHRNQLRGGAAAMIQEHFASRVSCIYAAPIDRGDAARCRSIIELMDAPFVLHIWDYLDGSLEHEEHRWLTERAARVYCLSEPMLERVSRIRPDAQRLLFSREASQHQAAAPGDNRLIINLIGDLGSYLDGIALLDAAVSSLRADGVSVTVQYVGTARSLRRVRSALVPEIKVLGFFENPALRDAALSTGHVSFLPGPRQDPERSLRSLFSIPSRILDFFATASPIVGTVHPESATGKFLRRYGFGDGAFVADHRELARALKACLQRAVWERESARSRRAFSLIAADPPPEKLRRDMQELAANRSGRGLPLTTPIAV